MNSEPRRRRNCSIIPPNFGLETERHQAKTNQKCCGHISRGNTENTCKAESQLNSLQSCKDSKICTARIRASSDNALSKENGFNKTVETARFPFTKVNENSPKRHASWQPTRKAQRSMSAHSVATPGPDSAVLRDPLTERTYKRGKLLGKGGFAKVYEGVELGTGKKYALKIIDKTKISLPPQREKVDAEIDLHAAASEAGHPNVTKFESTFENSRMICLVLELCSKKSLAQHLRRKEFLSESEVSDIAWQIICGLVHIHGCGLIHRDLKLGNILLSDDMTIKIADFGLATRTSWGKRRTICGTPNFIAPEVLNRQGHGPEADLWAVGCILFTLLVGKPPFDSGSLKDTYKCILKNNYHIPSNISQEAADLVRRLLQPKPQTRPTLKDVLNHSFFIKNKTSSRLPGIEELAKEYPHREIVSAPVLPLRRKSALPRMKLPGQDSDNDSYSSQGLQLRHGNCISDPCLVTSSAKFSEEGAPPSLCKSCLSAKEANEKSTEQSNAISYVEENSGSVEQKERSSTLTTKVENFEESNKTEDNNNTNEKTTAQQELSHKGRKMSPIKLLASKLQKMKIPSPKKCMKTKSKKTKASAKPVNASTPMANNEATWITKWVDYSNKYGFGYQLASGVIGVLFNDGSHVMLLGDRSTVEFRKGDWESAEDAEIFPISSPPAGYLRTVNILRLFINYMDQNLEAHGPSVSPSIPQSTVRMLTWSRTTDHVVMYLSNGTLQINFCDDHAKINVSNIHKKSSMIVSYVDKFKQASVFQRSDLTNIRNVRNEEIKRRLHLVHEELHFIFRELECSSHPYCKIFEDTTESEESVELQDKRIEVAAVQ